MRGRKSALVVLLTEAEWQQLSAWSRSTTTAVGLVRRANVILGVHRGLTVKEAARQAGLSETHARKWIQRFVQLRLQGLYDAARPGRPASFSPRGGAARGQVGL
jgi:hypothetical protein